jgi:ABC-type thiamin/hydroxymethylpyrimidine transport system permease subunit
VLLVVVRIFIEFSIIFVYWGCFCNVWQELLSSAVLCTSEVLGPHLVAEALADCLPAEAELRTDCGG